jgi:toxin-antitoxin system PIN domain toxin
MTSVALPDVNVLLALAWPNHQFHAPARAWFRALGRRRWATCAITQLGFIRLSSNPAFTPDAKSPAECRQLLRQMLRKGKHYYLDKLPSVADRAGDSLYSRMLGHQQVTDAYLVYLCRKSGFRLATFDQRLAAIGEGAEVTCINALD